MGDYFAKGVPSEHLTENALECYVLNTLNKEEQDSVEVHLLTCELCLVALNSVEQEISLLRSTLQHDELERRRKASLEDPAKKLLMFKLPSSPGN
jgi:hypothetical protein